MGTCVPLCDVGEYEGLGPLLCSIYRNDIVTVSKKFKFLMYADETTI